MGQGSNSQRLRRYNQRAVLAALRQLGEASKADVARRTSLTPQGVTRLIDDLHADGLIRTRGKRTGGQGQPSTLYAIDPRGAFALGVKIGRSDLDLVLTDFVGQVLGRFERPYDHLEPEQVLAVLVEGVAELTGRLTRDERGRLKGLGLAMPWFIGVWPQEAGIPAEPAASWQNIDFLALVQSRLGLDVFVENDCSAAALAESEFGSGADYSDFLYVGIDTFVGGGLVLGGELESGVHGNAGALFSMPVPASARLGKPAEGSGWMQLHQRASLYVLMAHLRSQGCGIRHAVELPAIMDRARVHVQAWLDDAADALVFAIQSALGLLDLQAVVLDAQLPGHLRDELAATVQRRLLAALPAGVFAPAVVSGQLGPDAMARGGAVLPFRTHFAPDKTVLLKGGVPERIRTS